MQRQRPAIASGAPGRFARSRAAALLAAFGAAAVLVGCGDMENGPVVCDRPATEAPVAFHGGTVDLDGGVYMTSGFDGELLHYPGGAYYQIFHQLGDVPTQWQVYLSFERDGVASGSIAEAAGNQAEVKAIDAESITVVNGSCSGYWMLLVAEL
jgi:hypothetical protein